MRKFVSHCLSRRVATMPFASYSTKEVNKTFQFINHVPLCSPNRVIIDVRSPGEFEEDRMPDALNWPVLSNEERQMVGIVHKGDSFRGRLLGAQLICENIAKILKRYAHIHVNNALISDECDKKLSVDQSYLSLKNELLIYCARGGQRSQSLAEVLARIGFRVQVLQNGYKTYRKYVMESMEAIMQSFDHVIMLQGATGCGKTLLLEQIRSVLSRKNYIHQNIEFLTLDLEDAAQHYGSILGERELYKKITQRFFESRIMKQLTDQLSIIFKGEDYADIDQQDYLIKKSKRKRILFIESESSRVGKFQIPVCIWRVMKTATIYTIKQNLENRIAYIRRQYSHFEKSEEGIRQLRQALNVIDKVHKNDSLKNYPQFVAWEQLIENNRFEDLVRQLIQIHYDIAYEKSRNYVERKKQGSNVLFDVTKSIDHENYRELAIKLLDHATIEHTCSNNACSNV
jgi:tRNA 2-selenouridine synthase